MHRSIEYKSEDIWKYSCHVTLGKMALCNPNSLLEAFKCEFIGLGYVNKNQFLNTKDNIDFCILYITKFLS